MATQVPLVIVPNDGSLVTSFRRILPGDTIHSDYIGVGTAAHNILTKDVDGNLLAIGASLADLANKADLVGGKIPAAQLPSGIDDIIEVATFSALPPVGDSNTIYLVLDTKREYRWAGTQYTVISDTIALGETASTAYRGDHGKSAFDHSLVIGNAHGLVPADINLGNVNNTSDIDKPISTATIAALSLKQDTLVSGTTLKTVGGVTLLGAGDIPLPSGTLTRIKTEVNWNGISAVIPTTVTNLITFLKAIPPTTGILIGSTFFDTVNDKMVVQNQPRSVTFKLSIEGSWVGGASSRSMEVIWGGTISDRDAKTRDKAVTIDSMLFLNHFSVDVGGNLATNGSVITIQSNGGVFTATKIKLIAEQTI